MRSMIERNPEWPAVVEGGDPLSPLGPFALYLSWTCHRIHDTPNIGRRSSSPCTGLYNERIEGLFGYAEAGTQVMPIQDQRAASRR